MDHEPGSNTLTDDDRRWAIERASPAVREIVGRLPVRPDPASHAPFQAVRQSS